jgi:uncharacterized protein YjbI with pentapeptide repeats
MPKKTAERFSASKKLAGKAVAFVGNIGYHNMGLEDAKRSAIAEGAKVVDAETTLPDLLVVGEGRGGKPPALVAKLEKKHPELEVVDEAGFCRLIVPTRDELLAELRAGIDENDYKRWEFLEGIFFRSGAAPDLSGADMRGFHLFGAKLKSTTLDNADLRGASGHYTKFPPLLGVKLDGADMSHAYFGAVSSCSFRNTDLTKAWFAYGTYNRSPAVKYERCDFREAKMPELRGDNCDFVDCDFSAANLSDAELEGVDFAGSKLAKADLTRAHCSGCKLINVNLAGANLFRADLRNASLKNADLRNADLREAVLSGADLSGANVKGADFTGAVLTGIKIAGVDASGGTGLRASKRRTAGPHAKELARVAAGATKLFVTTAEVDLGRGEFATLQVTLGTSNGRTFLGAVSRYRRDRNDAYDRLPAPTFEEGMLNLADRWPNAILRLDAVTAKGSHLMTGKKLQNLAMAAWTEAFGQEADSPEAIAKKKAEQESAIVSLREMMRAEILGGPAGAKKWSARPERERKEIGPLHNLDLHGANLAGVDFSDCDLKGSNFAGANLRKARFFRANLESTNFAGADLRDAYMGFCGAQNATFEGAKMKKAGLALAYFQCANFRGADLANADIGSSCLRGADFTNANLEGTKFRLAKYDPATKFPLGFVPSPSMELATPMPEIKSSKAGTLDFATFMQHVQALLDHGRLTNATRMLKAERFKLFSEVKDKALVGIVKSQSSKERVHSCRLASDGSFGCCTQNLKPCGGLQGALCKHLLVLVIGLTKAGQLDPATVEAWILVSQKKKPAFDKDAMADLFLRYNGAEAGEVDWRPTGTIPEDYYAM